MRHADQQRALARAAVPALAVIEADKRRAPKRLEPLFAAIVELLFEADLDLDQIQDAAGFADGDVFLDLREAVGQPAWGYLRDARLETAARLLLETEMSIAEAGYLVGYDSAPSFRQLMAGFLGMPPSRYRRRARRRRERAGPTPDGAQSVEYWERVQAGELSDGEARALDDYLERLAPGSASGSAPAAAADDEDGRWARLYQTMAEGFAIFLEGLSFADQRRLVREAVRFPNAILFEHLSRLGRGADSDDGVGVEDPPGPDRGIELALLAIDSLASNRMLESHPCCAALAWARLARARWRAGDLAGAEQDLERSARDFERTHPVDHYAPWEAERSLVAAAFHWHKGRRREALEVAKFSVGAHRRARCGELHKALVLRAELRAALADLGIGEELEVALADVEEARELRPEARRGEQLELDSLWLRILVLIGDRGELEVALPEARRLVSGPRLLWFEGFAAPTLSPRGAKPGSASASSATSSGSPARPSSSPASAWPTDAPTRRRRWRRSSSRPSAPWRRVPRTWRRSRR